MATYHPSQKLSTLDEPDMRDTAGEVGTNSLVTYSCGPPHMDKQRQDDQLEPIYNSSVPIQDGALKTYLERWMIETGGKRGSGRSMLVAWHYDDETFPKGISTMWNVNSLVQDLILVHHIRFLWEYPLHHKLDKCIYHPSIYIDIQRVNS